MPDFLLKLFDTSDFPARWNCGDWDSFHGWLHIASDLAIWAAYFMIPVALAYYWWKKRDEMEFPKLFWLFGAFIFSCGITHFIEAVIFYHPIYRVSGVMKFATAIISWMTVFAIIRITPVALTLPGRAKLSEELQKQLDKKHEIQERLAESNRELEAYTGRVAHDLRNPLSGLILLGNLALETASKGDAKTSAEQIRTMLESLNRMENSVKELHSLSLARNKGARLEKVSLDDILKRVVESLSSKVADSGTRITIRPLPEVLGNGTLFTHLFTNLIENAIKYRGASEPEILIDSRTEPGWKILTVSDNGRGIPEQDVARVFESNFRASNVGETGGSGIGLALCLSIMDSLGGKIGALPAPGGGTVIELLFPEEPQT